MPKLKQSEYDMKVRQFQATVAKQQIVQGYSKDQLAKLLRLSRSALWARLKDPKQFRVGELHSLHYLLRFTDEEKHILF